MFLAPCHDTNCNVGMSQTVSNQWSPRTTVRERWTLHVNAIRGVVVSGVDGAMSGETVACHEDDDQILVCALSLKHLFSDYVVLHSKTQVRSDPMLDVLYQRPWHRCQYLAMHFRGAIERGQTHSNRRLLVGHSCHPSTSSRRRMCRLECAHTSGPRCLSAAGCPRDARCHCPSLSFAIPRRCRSTRSSGALHHRWVFHCVGPHVKPHPRQLRAANCVQLSLPGVSPRESLLHRIFVHGVCSASDLPDVLLGVDPVSGRHLEPFRVVCCCTSHNMAMGLRREVLSTVSTSMFCSAPSLNSSPNWHDPTCFQRYPPCHSAPPKLRFGWREIVVFSGASESVNLGAVERYFVPQCSSRSTNLLDASR